MNSKTKLKILKRKKMNQKKNKTNLTIPNNKIPKI